PSASSRFRAASRCARVASASSGSWARAWTSRARMSAISRRIRSDLAMRIQCEVVVDPNEVEFLVVPKAYHRPLTLKSKRQKIHILRDLLGYRTSDLLARNLFCAEPVAVSPLNLLPRH